jgi:hypothetical protein
MFNITLKYQFQQLHRNKEYNLNIKAEIRMFSLPHKKVIIIVSMEEHFAQNHLEYVYTLLTENQ